jgi:small conductance mechanosensitive channel
MRCTPVLALLLAFGLCSSAAAQSPLAKHQPATAPTPAPAAPAPAPAPAPANPPQSAIIPGSPLAALTGAPPPAPNEKVTAPFGTDSLGFSITSVLGKEAAGTFHQFISAVDQSTRLTPIISWLEGFSTHPARQANAVSIGLALLFALLPALVVDAIIRFALRRPAALCAKYALPRRHEFLPEADTQGLVDAEAGETEKRPSRRVSVLAWLRRAIFALLSFGLALLPLAGFALCLQLIISSGVPSTRAANLAVIGVGNAYLVGRASVEFLRLLLAPSAPGLRLIIMPSGRATSLMRRGVVLAATGFFGYCLASIAVILGLSQDGTNVLIRLIALIINVEIAVAIWQSRHLVGSWIAGSPEATGSIAGFRRRLGDIGHYALMFYVLALWIAWVGGVHNAFGVLLRVVLVLVAALAIGRWAWIGSSLALERLFPDATALQHPTFFSRARTYNPLLRSFLRGAIGALVVLLILQGWGVNAFGWLLNNPLSRSLLGALVSIVITIAVALALWEFANHQLNGRIERLVAIGRLHQASRLRTLTPILRAAIGVLISIVAGFICLSKIGVNAAPLFAGAGVVGIAVGFGSQKLVQDIITGLFLLLEDAMQVGDVVSLAGLSGTVERLSVRTIRLRGGDGSVNIIPFSSVSTVTNMTREFGYAQIAVTVAYKENLERVNAVLADIARTMRAEPAWGAKMRDDLQIFGLDEFGALGFTITGQIRTGPGQHWGVRREFYGRVQKRFAEEGIEIPYNQQNFRIDLPSLPAVEQK